MRLITLTHSADDWMIALGAAAGQNQQHPKGDVGTRYSNVSLGFRYTPPNGMRDETDLLRSQIQQEEGAAATSVHRALLAMFSQEDGSDPNWRSLPLKHIRGAQFQNFRSG